MLLCIFWLCAHIYVWHRLVDSNRTRLVSNLPWEFFTRLANTTETPMRIILNCESPVQFSLNWDVERRNWAPRGQCMQANWAERGCTLKDTQWQYELTLTQGEYKWNVFTVYTCLLNLIQFECSVKWFVAVTVAHNNQCRVIWMRKSEDYNKFISSVCLLNPIRT